MRFKLLLFLLLIPALTFGIEGNIVIDNSIQPVIVIDNSFPNNLVIDPGIIELILGFLEQFDTVDWWRIEFGITESSNKVSKWEGSINSIDFDQGTGANQPTLTADQLSGFPAIVFDGTADFMTATLGATYTQPFTIIIVVSEPTDNGARRVIFDSIDSINRIIFSQDGASNFYRMWADNFVPSTYGTGNSGFRLFSLVYNSGSSIVHVDGVDKSPVGSPGVNILEDFTLAADRGGLAIFANIGLIDFIVIGEGLTVSQLAQLEILINRLRGVY